MFFDIKFNIFTYFIFQNIMRFKLFFYLSLYITYQKSQIIYKKMFIFSKFSIYKINLFRVNLKNFFIFYL